ncbi:ribosome biogenesis factor YjgA [Pseudomonadota bacterium]
MTDIDTEERKSKSQIKREMQALRDLGKELIDQPEANLNKLSLSDSVHDAVTAAKGFKKEAFRRQIQHIGVLLRNEDAELIRRELNELAKPHQKEVQAFHQIEQWRDTLIAGDANLLEELISRFQDIDRQYLRQLIRNAKKEKETNKPPKSARLLFRYLSDLKAED